MRQPAIDFLLAKQFVGIVLLSSCWCAVVQADPPAEVKPAVPAQTQVEITPEIQKQIQAEGRAKLEKARSQLAQDLREDRAKQQAAQKQALAQPEQPANDPQKATRQLLLQAMAEGPGEAPQPAQEQAKQQAEQQAEQLARMRAQAADRLRVQMQAPQGFGGPVADAEALVRRRALIEEQALMQARFNAAVQRDPVEMFVLRNKPMQQFKRQYDEQANQKIAYLTTVCDLRPDQVEKMRLAFAGDISRIMNRIVALRHDSASLNLNDRDQVTRFSKLLQPFSSETQSGPFGEGSLARSVLERTLDEHQKQAFEQDAASRQQKREHALTLLAVAALDEQLVLSKDQREQLVELLDQQSSPDVSRSFAPFLGQIKLARISDEELSKFLDAEQIALVHKICDPYRNLKPGGR